MSQIHLALTIPGTNTAELSALGIPMMILLPSQKPELYPLPGPAGHLHRIPLVGKYLKIFLLWLFWKRVKYLAHPNRKAGVEIVPEIVGRVSAEAVAARLADYALSPLQPTADRLKTIMGKPGAADHLVREILNLVHRENRTS
jgi:lipid-A-disaccharide synthase